MIANRALELVVEAVVSTKVIYGVVIGAVAVNIEWDLDVFAQFVQETTLDYVGEFARAKGACVRGSGCGRGEYAF